MTSNQIILDLYKVKRIIQYLKKCVELMEDKPRGTFMEADLDDLDVLIISLEKEIGK